MPAGREVCSCLEASKAWQSYKRAREAGRYRYEGRGIVISGHLHSPCLSFSSFFLSSFISQQTDALLSLMQACYILFLLFTSSSSSPSEYIRAFTPPRAPPREADYAIFVARHAAMARIRHILFTAHIAPDISFIWRR